jgi:ArsR family transcriptional regulator
MFAGVNIRPETFFAALAHPTRLRCLMLLHHAGELCVCELTHTLGASQPHVSRHLAYLREAGLVSDRRAGLWIHYRLHPELPAWGREVLDAVARGVAGAEPYGDDPVALAAMPNRPGARRCA